MTFAAETRYQDGTLSIDRTALLAAIAEPRVIADLEIHLAHPEESCRLVHVLDTVAPMAKVQGRSTVYPGFFGTTMPAGDGRNHLLRGAAVIVCATFPDPTSGALSPAEATIDMSGPAAPYCAGSDTVNVVLVCHSVPGVTNADFDAALHRAKLKAAVYLAGATAALTPPTVETYELSPVEPDLPRVVYVDQLHQQGLMAQTFLYGKHTQGLEPTFLHPNEMLDGGVCQRLLADAFAPLYQSTVCAMPSRTSTSASQPRIARAFFQSLFSAAQVISKWVTTGVTILTRSMSSRATSARQSSST